MRDDFRRKLLNLQTLASRETTKHLEGNIGIDTAARTDRALRLLDDDATVKRDAKVLVLPLESCAPFEDIPPPFEDIHVTPPLVLLISAFIVRPPCPWRRWPRGGQGGSRVVAGSKVKNRDYWRYEMEREPRSIRADREPSSDKRSASRERGDGSHRLLAREVSAASDVRCFEGDARDSWDVICTYFDATMGARMKLGYRVGPGAAITGSGSVPEEMPLPAA